MNFSSTELMLSGGAVLGFLILNAVFAATEFGLMKLRFTRYGTGKMDKAKESIAIATLLEDMSGSIKVLRLGITLCMIAMGCLLVPLILSALQATGWSGESQMRVAMTLSLLLAVGIHYVLGELVPRALAMQHPMRTLAVTVPLVRVFRLLAKPFSSLLNGFSGILLKGLRLDPNSDLNLIDVDSQIRSIVSSGGELPTVTERILKNVMDLRKRVAHDIMIPRNQLSYFDVEDSIEENLEVARDTGHTRFPVCEADLDQCIGIVHIKDVFRSGKLSKDVDLQELKRPIARFSMDEPLEGVLQGFLKQKQHFALLTDEFGGAVGAITLEDVLEELVGEIQDEFDRDKEMISKLGDGGFLVDGLTPLHDVSEEIGVELESDEVSTFGGYITLKLGRMPRSQESFRIDRLAIMAASLDDRRVIAATLKVLDEEESSEDASAD
ncbi:MAG: hemolysin family protein [Opitutales bacterium]